MEPQVTDNKLHTSLTDAEANLVLQGLGKLPAELSFNLIGRLVGEIQAENERRKAPPKVSAPPDPETLD
jgi:hypothetical protein